MTLRNRLRHAVAADVDVLRERARRSALDPAETAVRALPLPRHPDLEDVVKAVSRAVGRKIDIEAGDLFGGLPTGVVLALPARYRVIYPRDTSRLHQAAIITHELGHIALGHHDRVGTDCSTTVADLVRQALPLIAPDLSPELLADRFRARSTYDDASERAAERFASLLVPRMTAKNYWWTPESDIADRLHTIFGPAPVRPVR